ncbi:MAG: Crp/Fnr family transcriptional regulator, partial [Planctomycetes bacterium]|nr:Crp/Fnr family transcriptional regulator [Planctomycetota bacterium]
MAAALELRSLASGDVLATQGQDASSIFVLQTGELASKLVKQAERSNPQALMAASSLETWNDEATILAAESVMVGHYIESIVATQPSQVLVVPISRVAILQLFAAAPLTALSFGRALARKIVHANENLSSAQAGVARLERQLEGIYSKFYGIVNGIQKDAEGEQDVLDAIKNARNSKTYGMGQRLQGETASNASEMTRVIESY